MRGFLLPKFSKNVYFWYIQKKRKRLEVLPQSRETKGVPPFKEHMQTSHLLAILNLISIS